MLLSDRYRRATLETTAMTYVRTKKRSPLASAGVLIVSIVGLIGCGGSSQPAAARPSTTARLQIVQPTPNQQTGPDVNLKLDLIGAQVVDRTSGALSPDEGHIHVTVDGKLVSMAFGTEQPLTGLAPGRHSVQAEFVAVDHAPFKNRVVAATLFTVGA